MQMLKAKLYMLKQQENAEKISDLRGDVKEIAWGSQIRSYVLQPYTLIKDHRTGFESGNVTSVLDGSIDGFISAYLKWESLGRPQVKAERANRQSLAEAEDPAGFWPGRARSAGRWIKRKRRTGSWACALGPVCLVKGYFSQIWFWIIPSYFYNNRPHSQMEV